MAEGVKSMEWKALLICCNCGEVWESMGCYGTDNRVRVKRMIREYLKGEYCPDCGVIGEIEILHIKYIPFSRGD